MVGQAHYAWTASTAVSLSLFLVAWWHGCSCQWSGIPRTHKELADTFRQLVLRQLLVSSPAPHP